MHEAQLAPPAAHWAPPRKCIFDKRDLTAYAQSAARSDLLSFVRSLAAAVRGVPLSARVHESAAVLAVVALLVAASMTMIVWMGGEFLPPFNEGTLTINVQTEPGTSLAESGRVAHLVEALVLEVPEVASLARRTGRAELDEQVVERRPPA
jgi:Cu/Ag efflux pump CusA